MDNSKKFSGDGFLLLNKPAGKSSAQVLNPLKKMCSVKVGHTGTLDPFATGMLVCCIGKATKFAQYQLKAGKCYRACITLGKKTDTLDITGKVVETKQIPKLEQQTVIDTILQNFKGEIEQIPPKYSALKYKGRTYYSYAIKNIEIPIKSRKVFIEKYEDIFYDKENENIHLTVYCGSGTYIRSLAQDIGEKLGTVATLSSLDRVFTEPWKSIKMLNPNDISVSNIQNHIQPIDNSIPKLKSLTLDDEKIYKLQNGITLAFNSNNLHEDLSQDIKIYDKKNIFLGLAKYCNKQLQPLKILKYKY